MTPAVEVVCRWVSNVDNLKRNFTSFLWIKSWFFLSFWGEFWPNPTKSKALFLQENVVQVGSALSKYGQSKFLDLKILWKSHSYLSCARLLIWNSIYKSKRSWVSVFRITRDPPVVNYTPGSHHSIPSLTFHSWESPNSNLLGCYLPFVDVHLHWFDHTRPESTSRYEHGWGDTVLNVKDRPHCCFSLELTTLI